KAESSHSVAEKPKEKVKLVPLSPSQPEQAGVALAESTSNEARALLKNPKILSLLEDEEPAKPGRKPSAATPTASGIGSFTVQVGSYPDETAAKERVEALKKQGFPGAFFSAKELGSSSGTWFRVYLGQYSGFDAAKRVGDQLQAKGEVKNYIVRKN
ncbi:SPOR domain-containing protein, partial [bacterium]|nr:SPOR domain-containing protein [bacterium]